MRVSIFECRSEGVALTGLRGKLILFESDICNLQHQALLVAAVLLVVRRIYDYFRILNTHSALLGGIFQSQKSKETKTCGKIRKWCHGKVHREIIWTPDFFPQNPFFHIFTAVGKTFHIF